MATIRQLEYFTAVVELGSFTEAAAELGVTQPGLSHQLKTLEVDLGGALLQRTSRGPWLTTLGRAVLPHARAAIADVNRVHETARATLGLSAGTLDVTTINSLSLGALPQVLSTWKSQHPHTSVRLREHAHVDAVLEDLVAGQADLAITPIPDSWDGPRTLLGTEQFVVVLPPGHPLTGRQSLPLTALAKDAWVHFDRNHGLAGVLDHVAETQGFRPQVAVRTSQTAAALAYSTAGLGPALIPANMVPVAQASQVVRPVPAIERTVYVLTRDENDSIAQALADVILTTAELDPSFLGGPSV